MAIKPFVKTNQRNRILDRMVIMTMTAAILLPSMAMADADASSNICSVLNTLNTLLNGASIIVVTIAIIFSGYQIAFAHKRIAEVAPALIGGVMIGAAAQIAKMVIGNGGTASTCAASSNNTGMLMDGLHSAMHLLQNYA